MKTLFICIRTLLFVLSFLFLELNKKHHHRLSDEVKITDERWKACADKNALFLDGMDPERVLSGFRRTCKIETDAEPYGGWENSLIAGHGVGHYFSALAMRIACIVASVPEQENLTISRNGYLSRSSLAAFCSFSYGIA